MVRADPESAYEPEFLERVFAAGHLEALVGNAAAASKAAD